MSPDRGSGSESRKGSHLVRRSRLQCRVKSSFSEKSVTVDAQERGFMPESSSNRCSNMRHKTTNRLMTRVGSLIREKRPECRRGYESERGFDSAANHAAYAVANRHHRPSVDEPQGSSCSGCRRAL